MSVAVHLRQDGGIQWVRGEEGRGGEGRGKLCVVALRAAMFISTTRNCETPVILT